MNNVNTSVGNTSVGEEEYTLYGKSTITEMLRGLTFQISANSFFQTNSHQVCNAISHTTVFLLQLHIVITFCEAHVMLFPFHSYYLIQHSFLVFVLGASCVQYHNWGVTGISLIG